MRDLTLIARTLHGIEEVVAEDIRSAFRSRPFSIRHREVWFRMDKVKWSRLALSSADDIFVLAGMGQGIDHTRSSISVIGSQFSTKQVLEIAREFSIWRGISESPVFTVVGSFLGKRNYNRFEIEDSIGERLAEKLNWVYQRSKEGTDHPPQVTFRVHLWEDKGWMGLRVFDKPLHRRTYKQESRVGTLHPPLAYAMALLAEPDEKQVIIDPFCGAGTIAIETALCRNSAAIFASDLNEEQVIQTRENARLAGVDINVQQADAGSLPYKDQFADHIITNLPWDYTVPALGTLAHGPEPFWKEMYRILKKNGKAVLLTFQQDAFLPELLQFGFTIEKKLTVSLFGRHPEIWILNK